MIDKKYIWLIFAIMIIAQLYVPSKMIWDSESTIKNGTAYKFKTQPVDPYDPFRGKYIDLRYEVEQKKYDLDGLNKEELEEVYKAYAEVNTMNDGFAEISNLTSDKQNLSGDYIEVKIRSRKDGKVTISLPYDRYYMEESIAKPSEDYVREVRRDSSVQIYGIINIKDGNGVLTEVMINERPIADVVREHVNN
jgi:uncharacterized membrane-anchored protein